MSTVAFADTTLRDGPNSLWAQGMRTAMMLPIAHQLDEVGFDSIELECKPSKKIFRELRENPWERIRLVASRVQKTPLRGIGGNLNSFEISPRALSQLYMELMAKNGLRQVRMTEPANDVARAANMVQLAIDAGLEAIPNITFSVSPKHTDEYYAGKTKAISALDVSRICLKDPGGLLTPERMRTLVPTMQANSNGKTLELHGHCNTGLGPLNALEGVRLGIGIVHVAIEPLADGTSLPSAMQLSKNLRALGHQVLIDESALEPVSEHFVRIAKRYRLAIGAPAPYDYRYYLHQVPGGMISNLEFQLQQLGMLDRLDEVLEEVARVRADLGYPIMVTPFSQFVGAQAVINVATGHRYDQVTDELILYASGGWGEEARADIDADVLDKILDRRRATELIQRSSVDLTIEDIRSAIGTSDMSDEELLTRSVLGGDGYADLIPYDPAAAESSVEQPIISLVRALTRVPDRHYVQVHKGATTVTLAKSMKP